MRVLEVKMSNIISVENLSKKYITYKRGSSFKESLKSFFHREKVVVEAVKDVSFAVEQGDIIGILGPNGAGKSTTIKMLTGTLYPTEGNIDVMGYVPCKNRANYVRHMGAVFGQKSQLVFDIPPVDSFRMNKAIYGIAKDEYDKRMNTLVELLELGDKVMRPTRVLSLGERMKCEFIMAMLHNPKIVFLDEPTIGLDVIAKQNIREFIKEMNRKGTTFILTTHDLEDVEQLARNIVIINKGEKVFDNTIQDLRRNLGNKKIVELTLTKKVNLKKEGNEYKLGIEGTIVTRVGENLTMEIEVDLDIIPIGKFIASLYDICEFSDISIKELPMDKIITHMYRNND
jgi:ABC-2 type transport system ATP-binding protein